MNPMQAIITALVAGATAAVQTGAAEIVKDAYSRLKAYLSQQYAVGAAVEQLEKRPDSAARRAVVQEELADAQAAQDATLAQLAQALLEAIAAQPAQTVHSKGVTLQEIKAAAIKLNDITAQGRGNVIGVEIKGAEVAGAIEISGVRAGDMPAQQTPIKLRLDTAVPDKVTLNRTFEIAAAVRQLSSARLQEAELTRQQSGIAQIAWPLDSLAIRLRVEVDAPECEIIGKRSYSFSLYRGSDSTIYYFSLKPNITGQVSIVVSLYQEDDQLGATRASTLVYEQLVGVVNIGIISEALQTKALLKTTKRINILLLAANPTDTQRLRVDEEMRAIDQALRQAEYRVFDLRSHGAVRIDDLQELLLRHRPDIVHFSGHGSQHNAIILQEATGNPAPVRATALRNLFRVLKDNVRCVVLNACYTAEQAAAIAEVIDCVVGMSDAISDDAARQFATAFYRALGYGQTVQAAFALGSNLIELHDLPEAHKPVLMADRVAPTTIRFVDPKA